jgi:hypothetical protein
MKSVPMEQTSTSAGPAAAHSGRRSNGSKQKQRVQHVQVATRCISTVALKMADRPKLRCRENAQPGGKPPVSGEALAFRAHRRACRG